MKHITILLAALVVVLGVQTFSRADAPAGVQKWEYKVEKIKTIEEVNALGKEGWELVDTNMEVVWFKRPTK